jgi:hypothetical protein
MVIESVFREGTLSNITQNSTEGMAVVQEAIEPSIVPLSYFEPATCDSAAFKTKEMKKFHEAFKSCLNKSSCNFKVK